MSFKQIYCLGYHVCKTCKGTGKVGNLVKYPCDRNHIETTVCQEFTQSMSINWPPVGGYVWTYPDRVRYVWEEIKHHNWKKVKKCDSCSHFHHFATVCSNPIGYIRHTGEGAGKYEYLIKVCECNAV